MSFRACCNSPKRACKIVAEFILFYFIAHETTASIVLTAGQVPQVTVKDSNSKKHNADDVVKSAGDVIKSEVCHTY